MNKELETVGTVTHTHTHTHTGVLNKKETSIEKCFINNEYKKDKNLVYFYPFLYAKKHMEFY